MIEIDGSLGEGGGQIIRTAVALAAVTGEAVEIRNIRANRPKPGLGVQHLHAVKAVANLSGGEIAGLELRSSRLKFLPAKLEGFNGEIDIGTAGSITLLLQCLIPVALFANNDTNVKVIGGTDVRWSPPVDFYTHVFLNAIREMGCEVYSKVRRRGYYPKGGGIVETRIAPLYHLGGFAFTGNQGTVKGISHSYGLPTHVAQRQAKAAERILHETGYNSEIKIESGYYGKGIMGSGITLWQGYKSGSAVGIRGRRAELVGEEAAKEIVKELESESSIDVHLADHLIPYIALANDKSELKVRELTKHIETNMYVTKQFLGAEFDVEHEREVVVIRKG